MGGGRREMGKGRWEGGRREEGGGREEEGGRGRRGEKEVGRQGEEGRRMGRLQVIEVIVHNVLDMRPHPPFQDPHSFSTPPPSVYHQGEQLH